MARIRSVKPEFWKSEQIVELSRDARLFFIGLWNFCDDQGVAKYSPKTLRMEIFGADDDITSESIRRYVTELVNMSLVGVYVVEGVEYLHVFTFKVHQKPERPSYKHPKPPKTLDLYISRAVSPHRTLIDLFDNTSTTEQEKEKEREKETKLAGLGEGSPKPDASTAPDKPPAAPNPAVTLGQEVLKIIGRDPSEVLQFGQVHAWLHSGFTPEEIKTVAAVVGERMKPDIRDPLKYLGKAMADEVAKLRASGGLAKPAEVMVGDARRTQWVQRYTNWRKGSPWLDSWGHRPPLAGERRDPRCECPQDVIDEVDLALPDFLRRKAGDHGQAA